MKFSTYSLAVALMSLCAFLPAHTSAHAADYDQCFEGRNGVRYRRCLNDAATVYRVCIARGTRPIRCRIGLRQNRASCRTRFCVITAPVRPRP